MLAPVLTRLSEPIGDAWRRPLSILETVYVGVVLFLVGTAYCQLYCALAMPAMDGMAMPVTLSMWRSAVETVPALIAFELSKRALSRGTDARALAEVAAVLALSAVAAAALTYACHGFFFHSAMPLRPVIADRLPGITLTAIAIAWASRQARTRGLAQGAANGALPPSDYIDWVRAAGNYVEIRVGGRSVLRRMTMAQAEQALAGKAFVRVHRSLLLNRARIAGLDRDERPRHVRLTDGSVVKVGDAYRANLH
ncbi:LytTR family DNA-binding domain-containing protein [Sphingomonas sp. URHD0057]|uniref:LytTR family DNA-binding domain-containing protein n=1 Tax=Sphingomonas sp. URHD0057 TaxID=1380389 RepID=UPI00048B0EE1|nr:LytTR family DNA-binding domain-containing protein [Sphingomonas sp. URHD0057]